MKPAKALGHFELPIRNFDFNRSMLQKPIPAAQQLYTFNETGIMDEKCRGCHN